MMHRRRDSVKRSAFAPALSGALLTLLLLAAPPPQARAAQVEIDGPPGSGDFGHHVEVLPNGNIVVVDSTYDEGPLTDVGAVYLYDGATLAPISVLRGGAAFDRVGGGKIIVLANGNFVVPSADWDNGAAQQAGAVTFCSATTGCDGVVSAANSLVGSSSGDAVGSVTALPNGHYVVRSSEWDAVAPLPKSNAGAVTHCDGATGCAGTVSASNSLVGAGAGHKIGSDGIAVLKDGDYVVKSPHWSPGAFADAGAVTFCKAATGCQGEVGAANSLVGTTANDRVGTVSGFRMGAAALPNGNYVVTSGWWDAPSPGTANAGAVTFCNGPANSCANAVISQNNSLVGAHAGDDLGSKGTTVLANGNYVVFSGAWDNGATSDVGAVTFCNGTTGCAGQVSAANSLVGSVNADFTSGLVYALPGGDYVVVNRAWDNGGSLWDAGAVTHCNGATGCAGTVSASNSLVGSKYSDQVGNGGITVLPNGNYLVSSRGWDNGITTDAGAVTFCKATAGCAGPVSAANSLVGSTSHDAVGSSVTGLPNGNYLARTEAWNNGATADAGAVTFGDGTKGTLGPITSSNSALGAAAGGGGVVSFVHDPVRNRYVGRRAKNVVTVVSFETTAVADGNLDDASTWSNGVPDPLTNAVVPAGRTVTVNAAATIGGLSVAGGAGLVMNAGLRLTGGLALGTPINTGAHALSLSCTSAAAGAPAGYVVGDLEKQFCTPGAFTYPTGTAAGPSPVRVAVTSLGATPSSLTVRTNQGHRAGMNDAHSLGRYWTLAEAGDLTTDLSFNYPEADVFGFDATYRLYRWDGAAETLVPGVLDAAGNTISAAGITDFGDWAVGNSAAAPPPPDGDGDGLPDLADNCPAVANADQADADADAQGDACDPDDDNDGQSDADELACGSDPLDAGSRAADLDGDNRPDCADPDDDGDGERDVTDNCPFVPNPEQADADADGTGDACDPSPNGESQIVFASNRDGNSEIYGMRADGTGVVRLTNNAADDRDPALSPDGSRIVFTSDRSGNPEIYSMNVGGTGLTRLTDHAATDAHPSVSSKGGKIVFTSDRSGDFEIYSMNFDGSGLARLTADPGTDKHPVWSPDGSRIAFMSDRAGNFEIYSMDYDGAGLARLTNHAREDAAPTWSPDGSRIAFSSKRDGNSEIYGMRADGTDLARLTMNAASDGEPAWGADWKIAFSSTRDGNLEIYTMNADGAGAARLTINPAQDTSPHWTAAGGGPPSM